MVLESTMICIDNSEYMRNGDLTPTRLQCEREAAQLVAQCKLRSHPENAVGILAMADDIKVLSTMTQEDRKLQARLHDVEFGAAVQVIPAIKVAHLALKHRQNRNHKMRIVIFLGSPIEGLDNPEFLKLAKKLKKEKVNVDIVCFGEVDQENQNKLNEFIDTLNGKDGTLSNLVVVSGGTTLREALATSPICRADGGTGAPLISANGFDLGINEEEDPELALALRVSLEEQRARQRQEEGGDGTGAPSNMEVDDSAAVPAAAAAAAATTPSVPQNIETMTEEQQLALALQMSLQDNSAAPAAAPVPAPAPEGEETAMDVDQPAAASSEGLGVIVTDPEALRQLVDELPDSKDSTDTKDDKTSSKSK